MRMLQANCPEVSAPVPMFSETAHRHPGPCWLAPLLCHLLFFCTRISHSGSEGAGPVSLAQSTMKCFKCLFGGKNSHLK